MTVKGKNIHGDEYFYGPENGIGIFKEYTLDDFIDVDNITFSSKHVGCAMIELDRYAPLLPRGKRYAKFPTFVSALSHLFFIRSQDRSHLLDERFCLLPRTKLLAIRRERRVEWTQTSC